MYVGFFCIYKGKQSKICLVQQSVCETSTRDLLIIEPIILRSSAD